MKDIAKNVAEALVVELTIWLAMSYVYSVGKYAVGSLPCIHLIKTWILYQSRPGYKDITYAICINMSTHIYTVFFYIEVGTQLQEH